MKFKLICIAALLICPRLYAQANPYRNAVFPAVTMTGDGTSVPINLNSLTPLGGAFNSATIEVNGANLTTATFAVMVSNNNGATYYPASVNAINATSATATSITVTTDGLYQIPLAGITNVEFVVSGTFTATSLTFTLTATPNGLISKVGGSSFPYPGIVYATSASAGTVATSAQLQTAIGTGVYDASGAAASALTAAETYSGNASNLSSGTVALARLPGSGVTSVNGAACTLGGTCSNTSAQLQSAIGNNVYANATCPLTNATNICITAAPYNGSGAGATTTTTTAAVAAGATTVPVASCSTFNAGNGVLVTGAAIGTVSSCSGTSLVLTAGLSAAVASGVVVQHDETAAFQAAINALNPSSGTIWVPDGSYLVNGPLQDTSGANAILTMPKLPNYTTPMVNIAIKGFTNPNWDTPNGAAIHTANASGNFIGGYDAATGGGYAPFTNVKLDMENLTLDGPGNPTIVMVNAGSLQALTLRHVIIHPGPEYSATALPTNTAGVGVQMPMIDNELQNELDDVVVSGFYTGYVMTEHTRAGKIYAATGVNCFVFDQGTNQHANGPYNGNSVSVDYLWEQGCTNAIVGGAHLTAVDIQNADLEQVGTYGIDDPSSMLRGVINFVNPNGPNYCSTPINGAASVQANALECQGGATLSSNSSGGFGSALNFSEFGASATPNAAISNPSAGVVSVDDATPGDGHGVLLAGGVQTTSSGIYATYGHILTNTSSSNTWAPEVFGSNFTPVNTCYGMFSKNANLNYEAFCPYGDVVTSAGLFSWSSATDVGNGARDTGLSRIAAGVVGFGKGAQGDVTGTAEYANVLPGILYSAAGTALPACAAGTQGETAVVKDATAPTYMGAYASGGAITAAVICSYNGTAYSWLTH